MPKFSSIPQFPRANYEVDVFLVYLADYLAREVESGLDLDPDFQRGHVWTMAQRTAYMEYFVRGGELGRVIITNHTHWTKGPLHGEEESYVLVDGKQRLTTWMMFLNDLVPIFGHTLSEWEGRQELNRVTYTVKWRVLTLPDRASVLRYYLDLNSGGTPHAAEEIERVRALLDKESSC